MKRIVAVVGDFYHPFEPIKRSLEAALQQPLAEGALKLEFIDESQLLSALGSKPDGVILFKEDRVNPQDEIIRTWMTAEAEAAIVRYTEEGGGWLAWHSGLASYSPDGPYVGMLRGYFEYHPEQHSKVSYTVVEAGAEGLADLPTFAFMDEHYFVHCDRDRTEVFLASSSRDGEAVAGWRHQAGQGRVCCLTPAHTEEGLSDPAMLKLLASCVQWCSGQ